ncbi:MAG: hypothetical protein ACJAQ2_002412 [Vicingaceae bacterium]
MEKESDNTKYPQGFQLSGAAAIQFKFIGENGSSNRI